MGTEKPEREAIGVGSSTIKGQHLVIPRSYLLYVFRNLTYRDFRYREKSSLAIGRVDIGHRSRDCNLA